MCMLPMDAPPPLVYGYDHEKSAKNGACRASDPLVISLPVQLEWEQ